MMRSASDLSSRIRLILSQQDPRGFYADAWQRETHGEVYVAAPGTVKLVNEQVHLLQILHAQCSVDVRPRFVDALIGCLKNTTVATVVHAAVEIDALAPLFDRMTRLDLPLRKQAWATLRHKLSMESHKFSEEDLVALEKARRDEAAARPSLLQLRHELEEIGRVITRVKYLRLSRELLEAVNPEINTDRQQLVSRMDALGFRHEIIVALAEVEQKIGGAGSALDFKACMDLLRTVYEEIVEDAAKAAAIVTGTGLPPAPVKDFQPWNQLLTNTRALTADEGTLSQKLYNYLSNAGTHRLGSAPEQVRVSRNLVIELGLLIVGRVQGLQNAP